MLTFVRCYIPFQDLVEDFKSSLDLGAEALPQQKEWTNLSIAEHRTPVRKQIYSPFPPADAKVWNLSLGLLPPGSNRKARGFNIVLGEVAQRNTHGEKSGKEEGSEEKSESGSGRGSVNYDLCPPSLEAFSDTIAGRAETLFSSAHLLQILHDKSMRTAFEAFLHQHSPSLSMVLDRYLANQKALAAVAYANAIVAAQKPSIGTQDQSIAAVTNAVLIEKSQSTFDILLSVALPAYVTYQLTKEVAEQLPLQISKLEGRKGRAPDADGISEVFCLTDPNMKNNPVIFASREFFRLTQVSVLFPQKTYQQ